VPTQQRGGRHHPVVSALRGPQRGGAREGGAVRPVARGGVICSAKTLVDFRADAKQQGKVLDEVLGTDRLGGSPPPWPLPGTYGVVASRWASAIVAVVRTAARYSGKTSQVSGPGEPRSWETGV
jgi:hypothetical protein